LKHQIEKIKVFHNLEMPNLLHIVPILEAFGMASLFYGQNFMVGSLMAEDHLGFTV
jgi:hypothetical protein